MGIEDNINSLFDQGSDENESKSESKTPENTESSELPRLETQNSGIEKREFSRIDLTEKHIAVSFDSGSQFAKHYIDNISLGGMFVRTSERYQVGEILPIQFKVKKPDGPDEEHFILKAQVCRVLPTGVGLEFTNLDDGTRGRLEDYVRSLLPKGAGLRTQVKSTSVERLERIRQRQKELSHRRKRAWQMGLTLVVLIGLNAFLATEIVKQEVQNAQSRIQMMRVGKIEFATQDIRRVERNASGDLEFVLTNGDVVYTTDAEIADQLPRQLRNQLEVMRSKKLEKRKRPSRNNHHSRLR